LNLFEEIEKRLKKLKNAFNSTRRKKYKNGRLFHTEARKFQNFKQAHKKRKEEKLG
jgi:hypothetical protein